MIFLKLILFVEAFVLRIFNEFFLVQKSIKNLNSEESYVCGARDADQLPEGGVCRLVNRGQHLGAGEVGSRQRGFGKGVVKGIKIAGSPY